MEFSEWNLTRDRIPAVIGFVGEISRKQVLDSLNSPIVKALKREGHTPSALAKRLTAELNATEVKVFCHNGEVIVSDPLISWTVRQRARMDAHKLLNHYPPERQEIGGPGMTPLKIVYVEPEKAGETSRVKIKKPGNGSG